MNKKKSKKSRTTKPESFFWIDFEKVRKRLEEEKVRMGSKKWREMREKYNFGSSDDTNVFGKTQKRPSFEYIIKIAKMVEKPIDYFLYGDEFFTDPTKSGYIEIPVIKDYLSDEFEFIRDKNTKACCYNFKWLKIVVDNPLDLVSMIIHGDAMSPTLQNGDCIIINTGDTKLVDGGIFACNFEKSKQIVIRKFAFEPNKIEMLCDNPVYKQSIIKEDEIKIIGRIIISKRLYIMVMENF